MVNRNLRNVSKLLFAVIVFFCTVSVGCRQESSQKSLFERGRGLVVEGRYASAIPVLESYVSKHPHGKFASRADFFIAKAKLGTGDYAGARSQFQTVVEKYAGTDEAHKARYKIALLDLVQGDRAAALRGFRELADHPDGSLAPEARVMARFLSAGQSDWNAP